MRSRACVLAVLAIVGGVLLAAFEPRLHVSFPSVIDDWIVIAWSPRAQLGELASLGNPEVDRYRPGFVLWNVLQWHTLGAPEELWGPQLWGLVRLALLVTGVTLLAALLAAPSGNDRARLPGHRLLVAGVPLAALTAPSLVVDVVRYGPQEPLLVGAMALGAVLLVHAARAVLDPGRPAGAAALLGLAGLLVWAFGVLQKENSPCVLLLAPFLWPTGRAWSGTVARLSTRRRGALAALAGAALLPFVPVIARTLQLALAGERLYEEAVEAKSFAERLADQVSRSSEVLHTPLPAGILVAAVVLLAVNLVRTGVDWLSVGLLVVAGAFVLFAAEVGVVTSRYYLPPIVLGALVLARSALALDLRLAAIVGVALVGLGAAQAVVARSTVEEWVAVEREREALVREAAARAAGGCSVAVAGLNAELVRAVPVLIPLADEPARACRRGERYLVLIDPGGPGTETSPDDPVLAACAPESEPVYSSAIGKVLRCTARGRQLGSRRASQSASQSSRTQP